MSTPSNDYNRDFVPEDTFLMWIAPIHYRTSENRVASAAFTQHRMSVNWSIFSSVEDTLDGHTERGVASITAGLCWDLEQTIEKPPIEEKLGHCEVVGNKNNSSRRRAFAKAATANLLRAPETAN